MRIAADLKCAVPKLSPAAEQRLLAASWRGNVRELANALERGVVLARDGELTLANMFSHLAPPPPAASPGAVSGAPSGIDDGIYTMPLSDATDHWLSLPGVRKYRHGPGV